MTLTHRIKALIPHPVYAALAPVYHYTLALSGAIRYGFPSRKIYIVGVTGTKGKTSTTELTAALLEAAGYTVALSNTSKFRIAGKTEKNYTKRSMPGRMFLQHFLRQAVDAGCDYAVIEMTSEGAKLFRHKFIDLDALIFTNLSPEHIESHGSYENYRDAKLAFAHALESSRKTEHSIIVNRNDAEAEKFLSVAVGHKYTYGIEDAQPFSLGTTGGSFTWRGLPITLKLPGEFNIMNAMAAATFAESRGIKKDVIKKGLESFSLVRGRMERVDVGQDFSVIVDYAHTADSLDRAYSVYRDVPKICILGGTGGGRDTWKRKIMGEIADKHCSHIILTTEDPYDEPVEKISADVAEGIKNNPHECILDRREAMSKAFKLAKKGWVVFITGKGDGPYIMGPNGARIPWDDATVAREELEKLPGERADKN